VAFSRDAQVAAYRLPCTGNTAWGAPVCRWQPRAPAQFDLNPPAAGYAFPVCRRTEPKFRLRFPAQSGKALEIFFWFRRNAKPPRKVASPEGKLLAGKKWLIESTPKTTPLVPPNGSTPARLRTPSLGQPWNPRDPSDHSTGILKTRQHLFDVSPVFHWLSFDPALGSLMVHRNGSARRWARRRSWL